MGQLPEEWVREGSVGEGNSMGKGPGVGRAWYPLRTEEARVTEQVGTRETGVNSVGRHHLGARKRSEFFLLSGGARRSLDGF